QVVPPTKSAADWTTRPHVLEATTGGGIRHSTWLHVAWNRGSGLWRPWILGVDTRSMADRACSTRPKGLEQRGPDHPERLDGQSTATGAIAAAPFPISGSSMVTSQQMATRSRRDGRAAGRLRIAMIAACPFPYPRGTPIRIFRMAEALGLRGHAVHVVTYHIGQSIGDAPIYVHRIPRVPGYRRAAPGPTYAKLFV